MQQLRGKMRDLILGSRYGYILGPSYLHNGIFIYGRQHLYTESGLRVIKQGVS